MANSKLIFSKYQKQTFINKARNQKWVSLIKAINITAKQLPLFVILKGKK